MKGYTDFAAGFLGMDAVATKPIGDMKFMDSDVILKGKKHMNLYRRPKHFMR